MIAELNKHVDEKEPRELMADWIESNNFSLTEEVRDGKRPTFFYNQKAAEYVDGQIWISAIISAIALAGLAITLVAWPKRRQSRQGTETQYPVNHGTEDPCGNKRCAKILLLHPNSFPIHPKTNLTSNHKQDIKLLLSNLMYLGV